MPSQITDYNNELDASLQVGGEPPVANPILVVHSLLRGRYLIAIAVLLLGLVGGAAAGYFIKKPQYQSVGLIRVRPILPRILFESEQNSVMPMFDAFIESQVSLMRSQRVIESAMASGDWQAVGRGTTPEVMSQFIDNLEVVHPRNSELIQVTFKDTEPKVAMTAVRTVIKAYETLYGENDADNNPKLIQLLDDRRTGLKADLKSLSDRIATLANGQSTAALEKAYTFKIDEVNKLASRLEAIKLMIAEASGSAATSQPAEMTPEKLAVRSPQMARLLEEKRVLTRKLETDRAKGFGNDHKTIQESKAQLRTIEREIDDLLISYNEEVAAGITDHAGESLDQLKLAQRSVDALYQRENAEAIALDRQATTIQSLQEDVENKKAQIAETTKRIDQLSFEGSVRGRINIISTGDNPLMPFNDKRIAFAAVGGLGCAGLAIGIMLLFGLVDRRVRHVVDAETAFKSYRLLGVLPNLPNLDDPDQLAVAAQSVHHIRAMLQMHRTPGTPPSFAITSPSPGSGKTSLSMALGLSFAASGAKTLMIDCDIIGGGLTAAMTKVALRKVGHILHRAGLMDEEGIKTTLQHMTTSGLRFGETATQLGFVTAADVDHAVYVQQEMAVGLREALEGERLEDCFTGTGVRGLYLLPLGTASRHHLGQLSVAAITSLIDQAKKMFDAIIIDTGPVMGGLDASIACASADEVVMVVTSGEKRTLIERALLQLQSIGGKVSGLVFNRASVADISSSAISSSVTRVPVPIMPDVQKVPVERSLRLGPVAQAVDALTDPRSESRKPNLK